MLLQWQLYVTPQDCMQKENLHVYGAAFQAWSSSHMLLTLCPPLQNPNDISYVYSGYAPLSVRLAQLLARPGWRSIEEVLKMLPGPHFEERQQLPTGLQKKRKFRFVFTLKSICISVSLEWGKWKLRLGEFRHLSSFPVSLYLFCLDSFLASLTLPLTYSACY